MTSNGPVPLKSQMTRFHSDRRDPEKVVRDGYIETGILAINVRDERLSDFDKQYLKNLGDKLYGVRL